MLRLKYAKVPDGTYTVSDTFIQGVSGTEVTDGSYAVNISGVPPTPVGNLYAWTLSNTFQSTYRRQGLIRLTTEQAPTIEPKVVYLYCRTSTPGTLLGYAYPGDAALNNVETYFGPVTSTTEIPPPYPTIGTGVLLTLPSPGQPSIYISDVLTNELGFVLALTKSPITLGSYSCRQINVLACAQTIDPVHPAWVNTPLAWNTRTITIDTVYSTYELDYSQSVPGMLPRSYVMDAPFVVKLCVFF